MKRCKSFTFICIVLFVSVFICIRRGGIVWACLWKSEEVFPKIHPLCFLRWGISLGPLACKQAMLAGQGTLGICLFLLFSAGITWGLLCSVFVLFCFKCGFWLNSDPPEWSPQSPLMLKGLSWSHSLSSQGGHTKVTKVIHTGHPLVLQPTLYCTLWPAWWL